MAQVMAWCLKAPSHYLNQCWLISEVLWHSPKNNCTVSAQATILYNEFENYTLYKNHCHISQRSMMTYVINYNDVMMSAMGSQVTSLTFTQLFIQCAKKPTSKLHVTGLCEGNSPVTGEFPAQRVSNGENVSIWWHHHAHGKNRLQWKKMTNFHWRNCT